MKRSTIALLLCAAMGFSVTGCGKTDGAGSGSAGVSSAVQEEGVSALILSDEGVTLDGQTVTEEGTSVAAAHDIIYYEAGKGSDYGEGEGSEAHSQDEAQAHTVVTIKKAGTYRVSGTLSKGQLAIDLGKEAKTDPDAVVTLILDNVDITCTVAPALIFYRVYECDADWVAYDDSDSDEDYQAPSPADVDTSAAGANIILADGSVNTFNGSHVARIYKEGTTKKLHKYDGAFYSKMSMNIAGESAGTGVLNIVADNEGLDTELHLTINGGNINIQSQDDGINVNEDNVSVFTMNGGTLQVNAGLGIEGDGVDSNGSIVINGGNIYSAANERTPDGGLDADGEILLNGGFVVALGVRNEEISTQSGQQYMQLSFDSSLSTGSQVKLTAPDGSELLSFTTEKACQSMVFSSAQLAVGVDYTLTVNGAVQQYTGHQGSGFGGRIPPQMQDGQQPPELPDGGQFPQRPDGMDGQQPPEKPEDGQQPQTPDGMEPPEKPDGAEMPQLPDGATPPDRPDGGQQEELEPSTLFTLSETVHRFSGICNSQ